MFRSIESTSKRFPHDPALRGFHAVYRSGEINHCPACGRTHWYVGRVSAECGFCSTAMPLAEVEYSWGNRRPAWRTIPARAG